MTAVIERADAALHKAKQAGRRCSMVAEAGGMAHTHHALAAAKVAVPSSVP